MENREIKYKGINISGDWVYGTYHYSADNKYHYILNKEKFLKHSDEYYSLHSNEVHPVDPLTVCEFTGLKDKNGKEIYEGDIIKIYWDNSEPTTEQISFDDKFLYFKYGNNPICEIIESEHSFEVVGNIYEPTNHKN